MRKAFDIISAVGSSAASTCWPSPVFSRCSRAKATPVAIVIAVPKSA
jgi:hypothetical protein